MEGCLDGLQLMAQEFGAQMLDELTVETPR